MEFNWDPKKEKTNIKKHGISFEQAKEALICGTIVVLKVNDGHEKERYFFLVSVRN